ncbi:MAG: Superoxide dismutase, Fe-Mn family [Parcubacteria group bacterium GW2011_GWD2_38_12]|nr:MAG: Superoxide dismutase, Fe-Mn family [Parcubacteria group bacterium GW2011_GWC2_36_17]KKQ52331.1 MAG: Superoxide dismutase, Fe-Mn family [Parcubacteria group bacterium GW2011_GWD2_38_12]KKQ58615.1 MAG: Superoxide dismutase, Fe-Mn family [Parcubacteria group bacterium GW2011_GWC1_38_17]
MPYEIKNFDGLLGVAGFGDQLLKNHLTLYQGYVNNFNKLNDILVQVEKEGKYGTPEYAELNRRLGWEFNGMRLHELYFENIAKTESRISDKLKQSIEKEFGSFEFFEKDFKAMGQMRGIGWVILYQDGERLFNVWINEHDVGHFAGCAPLLVMDVFEHAYMLDYGLKKTDYIETFFEVIDWQVVAKRLV